MFLPQFLLLQHTVSPGNYELKISELPEQIEEVHLPCEFETDLGNRREFEIRGWGKRGWLYAQKVSGNWLTISK
jgi:hypothetical protein